MDKEHINLIFQIWNQITLNHKIKYLLSLILSLFSILIEFLSVLIFFPFVSIILTNTKVIKNTYSLPFIDQIIKLDKLYIYIL